MPSSHTIPWLLIIERGATPGRHVGLAQGTYHLDALQLKVRFDDTRIQTLSTGNIWKSVNSGDTLETNAGRFTVVLTTIESPEPEKQPALRLPPFQTINAALVVQDGRFKGCFFGVGDAPCRLGRGDVIEWQPGKGAVLIPGESSMERERILTDTEQLTVGDRKYLFVPFNEPL